MDGQLCRGLWNGVSSPHDQESQFGLVFFVMKCYLFAFSLCFGFVVYVVLWVGLLFIKF
jgi:hypothetical protein